MRKPPDPPQGLTAVDPREWMRVWLRVIADPSVKSVGMACAAFADYRDGAEIRPGNSVLAATCGIKSKKTVVTALAQIREWGLAWRYEEGARKGVRGMVDVYRLTIPDDIFSRVPMLDPEWEVPAENPANQVSSLHLVVDNQRPGGNLRNRNQVS